MKNNVPELQTKAGSLPTGRELLDQKNRKISTEVIFLMSQLNDYNAKLAHLKDEIEQNESVLDKYRTEKDDLQCELNESKEIIQNLLAKTETMENKMNRFEQLVNEGVEQRLEQHKVTEHSLPPTKSNPTRRGGQICVFST